MNDISLNHDRVANTMTISDGSVGLAVGASGCTTISPISVRCPLAGLRLELGGGNEAPAAGGALGVTELAAAA